MAPADPANAVAAGTTQNPLLGLTAQASSEPSPALRRPRVARVTPSMSQSPAARASGPISSRIEVRRHAATSERVADVTRICTRSTTGHIRCTRVPPRRRPSPAAHQQEADQAEHAQIVPCPTLRPGRGGPVGRG